MFISLLKISKSSFLIKQKYYVILFNFYCFKYTSIYKSHNFLPLSLFSILLFLYYLNKQKL